MSWYFRALRSYAVFRGRARRREYWFFYLFNAIATILLVTIDVVTGMLNEELGVGLLTGLYSLGIVLPALAVSVRRLHDTGRSAWWLLVGLIPILGAIALFVFNVSDSSPGENQYGPNPKAAPSLQAASL